MVESNPLEECMACPDLELIWNAQLDSLGVCHVPEESSLRLTESITLYAMSATCQKRPASALLKV